MNKTSSLRWLTQAKNDLKWTKANEAQKLAAKIVEFVETRVK